MAVLFLSLTCPGGNLLHATQYTWDAGAAADYWGDELNWDLNLGIPNSQDDNIVVGGATVELADANGVDASFTISRFGTASGSQNSSLIFQNVTGGTGNIIFQSSTGSSSISSTKNSGGSRRTRFDVGITLNNDLSVGSYGGMGVQFTRAIVSGIDPNTSQPFVTNFTLAGSALGSGSGVAYVMFQAANFYNGRTIFNSNLSTSLSSGGGKLQITGTDYAPTDSVFEFTAGSMGGSNAHRNQSGFFNLNGFNQRIGGLEAATGSSVGVITNNGATASILTIDNADNHVFNGIIMDAHTSAAGTTAVVKEGAGTQSFANAVNAYSGGTTVSGGVLLLSTGHAAASAGTGTVGASAGNSVVVTTGVSGLYIGQTVTSTSGNIPVGSRIIGIIAATNTIILSNTPTAGTDLDLAFGEASSLGIDNLAGTGGNVLINGGTLASDVSLMWVPGNLTLESGAFDPNQGNAGVFELNENKNFSMTGGTWNVDLGTAFDQITAGGTANFAITGGTFALDVTGAGFDYALTYQVLSGFTTGSVSNLAFTGYDDVGYTASLSDTGVLSFTAVPEPGAVGLLLAGASLPLLRRRRGR
jgi:autotransporter-associated beta strand protein